MLTYLFKIHVLRLNYKFQEGASRAVFLTTLSPVPIIAWHVIGIPKTFVKEFTFMG